VIRDEAEGVTVAKTLGARFAAHYLTGTIPPFTLYI
jgi:hypothetical protein